jgi:hypothetical protein
MITAEIDAPRSNTRRSVNELDALNRGIEAVRHSTDRDWAALALSDLTREEAAQITARIQLSNRKLRDLIERRDR